MPAMAGILHFISIDNKLNILSSNSISQTSLIYAASHAKVHLSKDNKYACIIIIERCTFYYMKMTILIERW
jgi:hypothetical protein